MLLELYLSLSSFGLLSLQGNKSYFYISPWCNEQWEWWLSVEIWLRWKNIARNLIAVREIEDVLRDAEIQGDECSRHWSGEVVSIFHSGASFSWLLVLNKQSKFYIGYRILTGQLIGQTKKNKVVFGIGKFAKIRNINPKNSLIVFFRI